MPTKEEMLTVIYEKIGESTNVGDEHRGDFWIKRVILGDVLDWLEKTNPDHYDEFGGYDSGYTLLLIHRKEKRKTINEQYLECIKFVYDLCK